MSALQRCPYYRGVRKERLDCIVFSHRIFFFPLVFYASCAQERFIFAFLKTLYRFYSFPEEYVKLQVDVIHCGGHSLSVCHNFKSATWRDESKNLKVLFCFLLKGLCHGSPVHFV